MSATPRINEAAYAKLLVKSLPRPVRTEQEHERLTQMLLALDERENPSPDLLLTGEAGARNQTGGVSARERDMHVC